MAVMKTCCRLESVGKPFLLVRNTLVGTMMAFTGSPTHRSSTLWAGRSAVISSTTERLMNGRPDGTVCDEKGRLVGMKELIGRCETFKWSSRNALLVVTKRPNGRYETVDWKLRNGQTITAKMLNERPFIQHLCSDRLAVS